MTKDELLVVQEDAKARFWAKVDRRGPDECWLWQGGLGSTGTGYGRVNIARRSRPATQIAWEIENGLPFPPGMNACHSCDNSRCVNPAHIWPGSQADNVHDAMQKGRFPWRPRQAFCKKGHALTPDNRQPTKDGSRCLTCHRDTNREYQRRRRLRG
jgi:hypothetical protein